MAANSFPSSASGRLDPSRLAFAAQCPDWPAPARVGAVFTERAWRGGAQALDPCNGLASFNLGAHVGDDPERVARHRAMVQAGLGVPAVYLNQVHGRAVQPLAAVPPGETPAADACWTMAPGQACAIMVADCLPVLFANRQATWVGAAHAGWRGLAGVGGVASAAASDAVGGRGVLEAIVQAYLALDAAHAPGDLLVWLGPCIGPTAFEVGEDVRAAFMAQAGVDAALGEKLAACFVPVARESGKFLANLPALARLRLAAAGVTALYGNDGSAPWCTVGNPTRYFSYRRDQQRLGASGRMCAYIWLRD